MKIKDHYHDVDDIIAKIQAITFKNKTYQALFSVIGRPTKVIVTRLFLATRRSFLFMKSSSIKAIVANIKDEGILVQKAKKALASPHLTKHFVEITENYSCLIEILNRFEASERLIATGYQALTSIDLGSDPLKVKDYINARLLANDLSIILNYSNDSITPEEYILMKSGPQQQYAWKEASVC